MAQRRMRRSSSPVQLNRVVATIQLADVFGGTAETDDSPKWVQVTTEGNFPGYRGGAQPFAFSRSTLDSMVKNIRAHPAYAVDEKGTPIGHVIPWDFNHASEADPTSGVLPAIGAPAQGWTLDLEVRTGADGKAQLWALTEFLEPARSYVRAGQYKWASVAAVLNAIDAAGKQVGAMLTSIALTNTPFIEGMEKLVASKNGITFPGQPAEIEVIEARRSWYEPARNVNDAIANMRELFGLPETSGVQEVMQHLLIVQGWLSAGAAPLGTDPVYITSSLRTILNLPTLTGDLQVIEEAGKSVQALIEQQASTAGAGVPPPANSTETPAVAASKRKDNDMEIKIIASKLGVRESDEQVSGAVEELVSLRKGIMEIFGLRRDTNDVILGAAKAAQKSTAKLIDIARALGVEDPEDAVARLAESIQNAAKLKEIMPELEGLRSEKKKRDAVDEEAEVDAAIAASKLPASVRPALLLHRRSDPDGFRKEHNITIGGGLVQPIANGAAPEIRAQLTKPNVHQTQLQSAGQEQINLARFHGANPTARAKAYLSTVVANWKDLTNEEQFIRAVELKKQSHVIDRPA